jgi:hypothetical protein
MFVRAIGGPHNPRDRLDQAAGSRLACWPWAQRSAKDDVSGPDPGLHVRMGHGDHVFEGRADGVRDPGGEVVPHPVHDAVDRSFQAIHPLEGDQHDDLINLLVKLVNLAVPRKQIEANPHVFGEEVELATRENERIDRVSRDAR